MNSKKRDNCLFIKLPDGLIKISLVKVKHLKGTVSVMLNDPSCKNENVWFTTVPLQALSEQV